MKNKMKLGFLSFLATVFSPIAAQAQSEGIGGPVGAAVDAFNSAVFTEIKLFGENVELIVIWMAIPMLFLTIYLGFINVRSFKPAFQILRGKFKDPNAPGEVSQFQALSTAVSGTVGLGNIAGVAVAISLGGPGAALWMVIIGFFAMTLKFSEVTLAVKYRKISADGTVSGGPMYYLGRGLKARGWGGIGKVLAWAYAAVAIFSLLQIAQVNQSYSQFAAVTGFETPWIYGIVTAILTAIVIMGGIKSIAGVTAKLVPLMAAIYIGAALFIIFSHLGEIPAAVGLIVQEAFKPEAGIGAVIAAMVWGMRRAVYSSEAGLGSATIAHAAAKTNEPVSEGLVALLEPFIDTVVICSMTALVIVITGAYKIDGLTDIQMTSAAFNSVISGFDWVLAIAVVLFAYSTIISWAYYTQKIWAFVMGDSKTSVTIFRIVFCVALIPGGVFTVQQVYDVMDSIFMLMAIPNIIGIYLMAGEIRRDTKDYFRRLKAGEIPTADQLSQGRKAEAESAS